jgi:hypothetical protein
MQVSLCKPREVAVGSGEHRRCLARGAQQRLVRGLPRCQRLNQLAPGRLTEGPNQTLENQLLLAGDLVVLGFMPN